MPGGRGLLTKAAKLINGGHDRALEALKRWMNSPNGYRIVTTVDDIAEAYEICTDLDKLDEFWDFAIGLSVVDSEY